MENSKTIRKKVRAIFSEIVSEKILFGQNADMQNYLKEEALSMELSHRSKNFIVINGENFQETEEWFGLVTLTLKVVDISEVADEEKKELVMSGKNANNIKRIPGILIAQLGKNTLIENSVKGSDLLKLALEMIVAVQNVIGGKMVFLDSVNNPKVIALYKSFGFVEYGSIIQDKKYPENTYQPMALDMTKQNYYD
ncbi:hypothetical protein IU403_03070 [Aerococcaceae bacterium zg-BR22]|uniref:hypothetical protein n=1 Tax=Aerococcaceae bacterium zg-1292 TaxID=2774330 RepID=UPI0040649AF8|nr:hypothetical protein [Aerococcaceae bacterium zg-BR22]